MIRFWEWKDLFKTHHIFFFIFQELFIFFFLKKYVIEPNVNVTQLFNFKFASQDESLSNLRALRAHDISDVFRYIMPQKHHWQRILSRFRFEIP